MYYRLMIFLKEFAYPAAGVASPSRELVFKKICLSEASRMKGNYVLSRDGRSFQRWCGERMRMWIPWNSFGGRVFGRRQEVRVVAGPIC